MTVALAMIARDEEERIGRALDSVRDLVDWIAVLDTGSEDDTVRVAKAHGAEVTRSEWSDFADARTRALALTRKADWTLMLDADQTVEHHPDLRRWLLEDADPALDYLHVETVEAGVRWRMPRLTRGGIRWKYEGPTHEWLDLARARGQALVGLTIVHHADGTYRADKHERDLALLAAGVEANEPRAVYYSAQALACLGRTEEAADLYGRRARMVGTWEEERWHAAYMAATLAHSVPELLSVYQTRPHRPEPLEAAARLVREQGPGDDVLFMEPPPAAVAATMRP